MPSDQPVQKHAHLVVANVIEGGLAACGVVMPYPKEGDERPDTSGLPRCPECVQASAEAADRKAERDAAAIRQ